MAARKTRKGAKKGVRKKIGRARSAITGKFVKRSTAKSHPRTTVVESTRKRSKKSKKR